MANGDLIKLGTFYLGGTKQVRPSRPWRNGYTPTGAPGNGDIPTFSAGQSIEIRDTDASDSYKVKWREVTDGAKKLLVADRVLLVSVSWDDLNALGLITGKTITIDGQQYKLRVMTGGSNYRSRTDAYSGGTPTNNEWDRIIVNEGDFSGLPTPNANDLDTTQNETDRNGTHNQFWNWYYVYSWTQEVYSGNSAYRSLRGYNSARCFGNHIATNRYTDVGWRPVLEILNSSPSVTLNTTNNRTLYENDTLNVYGQATDTDNGNIVNVKYQIDGGTIRALSTSISNGSTAIPFAKTLTFKGGKLFDGETAITNALEEGAAHQLKVWSEDDQGGKSTEHIRSFYVVPNRAPALTVNPFETKSDLINVDKITITGTASDPDGNDVVVSYRLNKGLNTEIYRGKDSPWSFDLSLKNLIDGENTVVIEVVDSYNFKTSKTLKLNKNLVATPLLQSVKRYQIVPPSGSAKGVLLWVQRQTGLTVTAEISMRLKGEQEVYEPMLRENSAPVTMGIIEDEFIFESDAPKDNIVVKLTLTRDSADVSDAITLISGVLS